MLLLVMVVVQLIRVLRVQVLVMMRNSQVRRCMMLVTVVLQRLRLI